MRRWGARGRWRALPGLALVCLLAASASHAQLVTDAQITRAQQALVVGKEPWASDWAYVLGKANTGLSEAPSALANFYVPAYYQDSSGHEAAKKRLRDDVNAAYHCALAYRIGHGLSASQRAAFSAKAREILDDWAETNTQVSGSSQEPQEGHLVMAYVGTAFVTTAELLSGDPNWSAADRAQFTAWTDIVLREVATIESRTNNWGSWGVFAGIAGAHWRDDTAALTSHRARLRALIDSQINDQGALPIELGRDKPLWYTYFSLAPLTHAAFALRNATGEDLFAWQPPSGGTLEDALGHFYQMELDAPTSGSDWEMYAHPDAWGGDLLYTAGHLYGDHQAWIAWSDPPFGASNSAWKSAALLVPLPEPVGALFVGAVMVAVLGRRR